MVCDGQLNLMTMPWTIYTTSFFCYPYLFYVISRFHRPSEIYTVSLMCKKDKKKIPLIYCEVFVYVYAISQL